MTDTDRIAAARAHGYEAGVEIVDCRYETAPDATKAPYVDTDGVTWCLTHTKPLDNGPCAECPEDDRPVGEVPPEGVLDRRRAEGYVPTTEQVRNNMAFGAACAFVALRKPDGDLADAMRDIDWPMPGLRVQIKAEFDQWLATLPTPDTYQALLTQLHEAREEAARLRAVRDVSAARLVMASTGAPEWRDGYAAGVAALAQAQDDAYRAALLDGEARP